MFPGPSVTFFGLAGFDGWLFSPTTFTLEGTPIYKLPPGFNFYLVVEGKPGGSRKPVGTSAFDSDASDPTVRPDLQVEVTRPLGNGSTLVCDNVAPNIGGVPAVNPPDYSFTQAISDAINDLGCRFVDGRGDPVARDRAGACTMLPDGQFQFANLTSTVQYCGAVFRVFAFPQGDTLVTAKLRDTAGNLSYPSQLIVRNSTGS